MAGVQARSARDFVLLHTILQRRVRFVAVQAGLLSGELIGCSAGCCSSKYREPRDDDGVYRGIVLVEVIA